MNHMLIINYASHARNDTPTKYFSLNRLWSCICYTQVLTLNLLKQPKIHFACHLATVMSIDVIIRRNISFVGCRLIIAAKELSKMSRSLFIILQWRRRCISSSISFDSHLVLIRWFIVDIGLLYRPLSIFKSCELIWYLAIVVMRWFPFIFRMYGSTHKDFFTNEYVRSILELSISCPHRCVNILTIIYLKENINLFVLSMCCFSQTYLAQLI